MSQVFLKILEVVLQQFVAISIVHFASLTPQLVNIVGLATIYQLLRPVSFVQMLSLLVFGVKAMQSVRCVPLDLLSMLVIFVFHLVTVSLVQSMSKYVNFVILSSSSNQGLVSRSVVTMRWLGTKSVTMEI